MAIPELDIRPVPPPQRHPRIFGTFDALAPGEAFVLINDHYPKPLLYQLQAERPGRFDWNVIERGPERYRVEIRRRPSEGARGVYEYLQGDHRRLDGMLEEIVQAAGAGSFATASERFAEVACGLDSHIVAEESVLFPALEKANALTAGPIAVMRAEHVGIRHRLEAVSAAIAGRDPDEVTQAVRALTDILAVHNLKEESIVYPVADQSAGGERDRDDLVRRLQAAS